MEIKENAAIVREKELTKRTERQSEIEREKQKQETERAEIAAKSEREIGLNKLTLRGLDLKILQEKQKSRILELEAQKVAAKEWCKPRTQRSLRHRSCGCKCYTSWTSISWSRSDWKRCRPAGWACNCFIRQ